MAQFLVTIRPSRKPAFVSTVFMEGDIVDIQDDDFKWGNKEKLGDFLIFSIPGLPLSDSQKYLQPLIKVDKYDEDGDPDEWTNIAIRKYKIPFTENDILEANSRKKVIPIIITESQIVDKSA